MGPVICATHQETTVVVEGSWDPACRCRTWKLVATITWARCTGQSPVLFLCVSYCSSFLGGGGLTSAVEVQNNPVINLMSNIEQVQSRTWRVDRVWMGCFALEIWRASSTPGTSSPHVVIEMIGHPSQHHRFFSWPPDITRDIVKRKSGDFLFCFCLRFCMVLSTETLKRVWNFLLPPQTLKSTMTATGHWKEQEGNPSSFSLSLGFFFPIHPIFLLTSCLILH